MRGHQRLFDGPLRNLGRRKSGAGLAAPLAEQFPGVLQVVHAERQVDGGVVVAKLPEAQGEVKNADSPQPAEQRIERVENDGDEAAQSDQRNDHRAPGPGAVMRLAGIETPLDPVG